MSQPASAPVAPGKTMLKVVSILFIIGGGLGALLSLIAIFTLGALGFGIVPGVIAGLVLGIIGSAAELVVGIMGLKKCDDPKQAMFFIVTGIVLCAVNFISMILYFQASSLISFVLPILYIVGGFMNKKAA